MYANHIQGLSRGDTAPPSASNAGEVFAPYKARQNEVGVKAEIGGVIATLSAFQITKPSGQLTGTVFAVDGEQRNRGVELALAGEAAPGLRLLGGLTLLDADLTQTNSAATLGRTAVGVPSFMARNITELRDAQDELRALNRDLEQRVSERTQALTAAMKELESFSYAVSHDLKAPLRGIDGYSRILIEDYGDRLDEQGRRFLGNIRNGASQMHALIEDLLAYSRMDQALAQGTALVMMVPNLLVGWWRYQRRHPVPVSRVLAIAAVATATTAVTAHFAARLDPTLLRVLFGGFMSR